MSIFSPRFWVQSFVTVLVTLIILYLIKKIAGKINIPVVSEIAEVV